MTYKLHVSKIIITNNNEEPIINGGILTNDSIILKVARKEDFGFDLSSFEIIDHGSSLICPGFINLHTHLLYSKVKKTNTEKGLFYWLGNLIDVVSTWTEKDYVESVDFGINEALSCGTIFVIENTPNLISAGQLSKSALKALIGLEVFGADEERADGIFLNSIDTLNRKSEFTLSPHAPYDVSVSLWKKLIAWSEKNNKPLLTHLEESPHEKIWWQEKSGEAVNFWRKINKLESKIKYWKKYNSGIDFLNKNDLLSKHIIATHLCQSTKEELVLIKENNIKLVHCPRSNFFLNNGTANLKLWNELGILWGIGTDSLASNENLDLIEEVRFAVNQQKNIFNFKISAKEAFEAITIKPAKILNLESKIGSLKTGAFADFIIYEIKDKPTCKYNDPYEMLIFELDNKKHLKEVWINGVRAYQAKHILHKI